jgi:hypothetical protein
MKKDMELLAQQQ